MHAGEVALPMTPPRQLLSGILVNGQGQRFINEDTYNGRVGQFAAGRVELARGSRFVLDRDPAPGDETRVELPHRKIFQAIEPGARLLLDDGKVRQLVAGKTPTEARNLLLSLSPGSAPRISLTTFWADRVPPFPFRITVRQNYAS